MPQKPLIKNKKIDKNKTKQAANRHGKTPRMKKGHFELAPKKPKVAAEYKENKEITKAINAENESNFAAQAQNSGGRLKQLKAPPPVNAPKGGKDAKKSGAKAKEAAANAQ